jgi:integral membrane sensor domain MASE1
MMLRFSLVGVAPIDGAGQLAAAAPTIAKVGELGTMPGLKADESHRGVWARGLGFAALYAVAMIAGVALTRYGAQVAPVWVASAVLAWALLTAPTRHWTIYIALAAIAHIISGVFVGDQAEVEIAFLLANMASPVMLAALMRWRGDRLAFEERAETLRFLLIGGLLAPGVSTAIVALASSFGVLAFNPRSAATWFLADGLSFVVFLPLINVVATNGWKALLTPVTRRRTFLMFAILLASFAVAWLLPASGFRVFMMLLIPYLIYVAFDLGLTAARAAVAISAVLMMSHALFSPAPADRAMEAPQYLLAIQVYVAVVVASVLPIAVALAERQRLYETASQALHDAQEAWGELLATEARYQFYAQSPNDLILRIGGDGVILSASPSAIALLQGVENLAGVRLIDIAHAEDAARVRDMIAALMEGTDAAGFWQLRFRDMNDAWVTYEVHASLSAPGEIVAVLRVASP